MLGNLGQWFTCNSHIIFKRLAKALIRPRVCTGSSEPLLVAHTCTTLLEISCRGLFFLAHRIRISAIWDPWIENLILPRTSSKTSSYELASKRIQGLLES